MRRKALILHPVFIVSLLVLLLNDLYFKETFSNELTGKLSDFAGLVVFPVFLAHVFRSSTVWICILTGFSFLIWKTPYVTPVLDYLNSSTIFTFSRVVDYSDYWALFSLPLAQLLISGRLSVLHSDGAGVRITKAFLTIVALFSICATTMLPATEIPKGTIYIGKEYTLKKSKDETIEIIRRLGYNVTLHHDPKNPIDSALHGIRTVPYYQSDNIVFYENSVAVDSVLNVKYTLDENKPNRTKIKILTVTLSQRGSVQRWQTLKYLSRQYGKLFERQIVEKIK